MKARFLRVTPPRATEFLHEELNRFPLSVTNFFQLLNKNMCNIALKTY